MRYNLLNFQNYIHIIDWTICFAHFIEHLHSQAIVNVAELS